MIKPEARRLGVSIRLRLTLWYSVILALTLIAFSSILYTAQSQYTLNIVKNDLVMSANRIVGMLMRPERGMERGWLVWWAVRRTEGIDLVPLVSQPPGLDMRSRDMVRLLDTDGLPFDLPLNESSEELTISAAGLAQLRDGTPVIEITHGEEGRVLTYNMPVEYNDQIIAIVQTGRSLIDRDRTLRGLGMTLVSGSLLTTLIAFGVGWALAGAALRPIHRITQTAKRIGETGDFSSRVPYHGPNDELGRLATTFNQMLSRLADSYQQVTHALQMQRDFVADVSHELRTPLTTIRGNLALLSRWPPIPSDEQQDVLADLVSESERLIRLVTNLLTLARADAGRRIDLEPLDLKPLVDEACRQARILEPTRQIEWSAAQPTTVLANADAIKQVLLILLDNALKHTAGTVRVMLGGQDGQVRLSVQDQGPGIPPDMRQRIFDRFYRGDESRSTPGFGLGLAIAQVLVEAQHGAITVESEVDRGSTFTVSIPQAQILPQD